MYRKSVDVQRDNGIKLKARAAAVTKLVSKCERVINEQLQKTSGADVSSFRKTKIEKPREGWHLPLHPTPHVRGLNLV